MKELTVKEKKIVILMFILMVASSFTFAFCVFLGIKCSHIDSDIDGKCDKCFENVENEKAPDGQPVEDESESLENGSSGENSEENNLGSSSGENSEENNSSGSGSSGESTEDNTSQKPDINQGENSDPSDKDTPEDDKQNSDEGNSSEENDNSQPTEKPGDNTGSENDAPGEEENGTGDGVSGGNDSEPKDEGEFKDALQVFIGKSSLYIDEEFINLKFIPIEDGYYNLQTDLNDTSIYVYKSDAPDVCIASGTEKLYRNNKVFHYFEKQNTYYIKLNNSVYSDKDFNLYIDNVKDISEGDNSLNFEIAGKELFYKITATKTKLYSLSHDATSTVSITVFREEKDKTLSEICAFSQGANEEKRIIVEKNTTCYIKVSYEYNSVVTGKCKLKLTNIAYINVFKDKNSISVNLESGEVWALFVATSAGEYSFSKNTKDGSIALYRSSSLNLESAYVSSDGEVKLYLEKGEICYIRITFEEDSEIILVIKAV